MTRRRERMRNHKSVERILLDTNWWWGGLEKAICRNDQMKMIHIIINYYDWLQQINRDQTGLTFSSASWPNFCCLNNISVV